MWLTVVIPVPKTPKKRTYVFIRPLLKDLFTLSDRHVETHDANSMKFCRFNVDHFGFVDTWYVFGKVYDG